MSRVLRTLARERSGSVVIETAFVLPILAMLALGGFEASRIVSNQVELQTASSEAAAIVLANPPDENSERLVIEDVIEESTGLDDADVVLSMRYRCGSATALTNNYSNCSQTDVISEFILLTLTKTYTPIWTTYGIGEPLNFRVRRRVQIA